MRDAMPEDMMKDLYALRDALLVAAHGGKRTLVEGFADEKGVSPARVYKWLRVYAGYVSGRKPRADKGRTRMPEETLLFVAATQNQSVRNTGVSTKPVCVALNIAEQNGLEVNLSASRVCTLLRQRRLDVKTQASARNHQRLRSLHPNHVHQIDPSLCLIYYMGGKQLVMHEAEFNKNKPFSIDKVKLKVWRYVRYDHASGSIDVRYFEAAGENQRSLFEFLMHTWGRCETRLSYGVPKMLVWDKGSANTSAGIKRLCDALGVEHETHATHHAWVKGGVENANWVVERHFESRLRDEPVETVEQLNASAAAWVRDYNANAMAHIDSRVQRDDGCRHVRDDLWSLIAHHPGALVELPPRAACAWFMRGKEETRQIRDGHISFAHPQSGKSELYSLQAWAKDFYNGQKVKVSPLLMGDCVVRVELERHGQEPLYVDVAPEREFDAYGRPLSATLIGTERRIAPHTAAQEAAKQIAAATYGAGTSLEDAEAAKSRNQRPFMHMNDGKGVVAHSHLGQGELPQRLLPEAGEVKTIALEGMRARAAIRLLNHFEAAREMVGRGVQLTPERNAQIAAWYPEGVPETELDQLQHRLTVRAGLRVVGGKE